MRVALLLLVVLGSLLAGCATPAPGGPSADAPGSAPPPENQPAPTPSTPQGWSFTDIEGNEWTAARLEGKPALLFFMATWCGTCRSMSPALAALHETYGEDVQFLSVDFDPTERAADLQRWERERGHHWPHGTDPDQDVVRAYRVRSQSTVVVLDAAGGVILSEWRPSREKMESTLQQALDRAAA